MKKLTLITFALLISVLSFGQGFNKADLRAGGGLFFASDINNIGLNFNAAYSINYDWEAAVAYTHFFEKDYVTFNVLDFDGHYIFYTEEGKFNVYGLAGLSVNFVKVTVPQIDLGGGVVIPETTAKDSDVGLNLGIGLNYNATERLNLAPEFRLTIADGTYVRIGAMAQYRF